MWAVIDRCQQESACEKKPLVLLVEVKVGELQVFPSLMNAVAMVVELPTMKMKMCLTTVQMTQKEVEQMHRMLQHLLALCALCVKPVVVTMLMHSTVWSVQGHVTHTQPLWNQLLDCFPCSPR